jgi:hypothetical protein
MYRRATAADSAQFAACAFAIGYAGARLTRLADAIGDKTGLSFGLFATGSILANVAPVHAVTAFSAAMMSGAVIIGLACRPQRPWPRAPGVVSPALLAV